MPIVDGLTSAKMIRSFEKSHPTHVLSSRASLNGRIPVIAVSASLVEKERQSYIDAGFDGWILKPISFNRLGEIMEGIVDPQVRKANLYKVGNWERGGWFEQSQKHIFAADTTPNEEPPMTAPSEGVKIAAAVEDPFVKEEGYSRQTQEQQRLGEEQAQKREALEEGETAVPKAQSMPELGARRQSHELQAGREEANITEEQRMASPQPMTPDSR